MDTFGWEKEKKKKCTVVTLLPTDKKNTDINGKNIVSYSEPIIDEYKYFHTTTYRRNKAEHPVRIVVRYDRHRGNRRLHRASVAVGYAQHEGERLVRLGGCVVPDREDDLSHDVVHPRGEHRGLRGPDKILATERIRRLNLCEEKMVFLLGHDSSLVRLNLTRDNLS